MTLVIGLCTPNWVVLAADRMLSDRSGKSMKDNAVKLVVFHKTVFGYTGVADLKDELFSWVPTDVWLARLLQKQSTRDIDAVAHVLREAADAAVGRLLKIGRPRPYHAFLGVGWQYSGDDARPLIPCSCLVSNFHTPDGKRLDSPVSEFIALVQNIDVDECRLVHAGTPIKPVTWSVLMEHLAEIGDHSVAPHDRLKEVIRKTSDDYQGRYVGKDVLASVITIEVARTSIAGAWNPQSGQGVCFSERPISEIKFNHTELMTCLRLSPGRDEGEYEMPHVVAPGMHGPALMMLKQEGRDASLQGIQLGPSGGVVNIKANRMPKRHKRRS